MNRVFVLKDVAYAAKQGGGKVAAIKDINLLSQGALAFFSDKGTFLDAVTAAAALADSKSVQVAVGRALDTQVITVPRRDVNITRGNYRAFVKPIITVGNLSLSAGDEGEMYIKVSDISYTSKFNIRTINASIFKKSTTSVSDAVDELVAKLNLANSFVVAAKVGAGPYTVTITPKEDAVSLSVAVGGLLENDPVATTTAMTYGIGRGVDVLQMEKDASAEEGNGNYIDYGAEHYSRSMETVSAGTYDLITLLWEGTHSSPTRSHNVMNNKLAIAVLSTAVADGGVAPALNQATAEVMSLLALIFPTAYSGASAAETAAEDGLDNDGIAGN